MQDDPGLLQLQGVDDRRVSSVRRDRRLHRDGYLVTHLERRLVVIEHHQFWRGENFYVAERLQRIEYRRNPDIARVEIRQARELLGNRAVGCLAEGEGSVGSLVGPLQTVFQLVIQRDFRD